MVWFRVDDQFYGSKEVMAIPAEQRAAAVGMWTLAGAWSSAHLTDGAIPAYMLETFGGNDELAALLVRPARLWTKKRDGYLFRNWEKWQITRQEVDEKRQAERDRKAAYRQKRQENTGVGPEVVPEGQIRIPDPPSHPIPSQPNPTHKQTPPSSVQNDDDQSYPQPSAYAQLIDTARDLLERQGGGETVAKADAGAVVDEILERGGNKVRNPTAYIKRALTGESAQGWVTYAHGGRMPE